MLAPVRRPCYRIHMNSLNSRLGIPSRVFSSSTLKAAVNKHRTGTPLVRRL
jgi:hypothetical protein